MSNSERGVALLTKSGYVAAAGLLLLASYAVFRARPQIIEVLNYLPGLGIWAPVLFIATYALIVILMLPGAFLTLGAGFLFGVVRGTIYVLIAFTLGSTIAFLIARHFLGQKASDFILRHPRFRAIDDDMLADGWKIILITRLVPFFPGKIANYFFGLAGFRLSHFIIATLFGIVLNTVANVYIGSLVSDAAALGSITHARPRTPMEWTLNVAALLTVVFAAIYLTRWARREWRRVVEVQK